jgi:hypothetical protein
VVEEFPESAKIKERWRILKTAGAGGLNPQNAGATQFDRSASPSLSWYVIRPLAE